MRLESFKKSRSRMKVSDVWRNLVRNTWTADFPNWVRVRTTKAALVVEERSWRRPDSAMIIRYNRLPIVIVITRVMSRCVCRAVTSIFVYEGPYRGTAACADSEAS